MINNLDDLMSNCQFFIVGIVVAIIYNINLTHKDGKILQNRN